MSDRSKPVNIPGPAGRTHRTNHQKTLSNTNSVARLDLKKIDIEITFIYEFYKLCDKQLKTIEVNKELPIDQLLNKLKEDIEPFNFNTEHKTILKKELETFRNQTRDQIITYITANKHETIERIVILFKMRDETRKFLTPKKRDTTHTLLTPQGQGGRRKRSTRKRSKRSTRK